MLRPLEDLSLSEQAFTQLREAILSLRLRPGEPLVEQKLANALGISKTPIRQALLRLEQTGLVSAAPNRGYFVSHLTLQDAREILAVRGALEGLAAGEACMRLSPQELEFLTDLLSQSRAAFEHGYHSVSEKLGHQFHLKLMEVAGNERLSTMIGILNDQYHRVRLVSNQTPGRLEHSLDEHEAVLAALAAGNVSRSEQLMRRHLLQVYQDLERDANVADDGRFRLEPNGGDFAAT